MANVLELRNVRKAFGPEVVLNDLSLKVPEHTATVLIGASGSGKSTLLRCINLLETIDDGQIFLDSEEITDPSIKVDDVRRKLGMVFQSFNLFPHKTVLENITLAPIKVQGKDKEEARESALKLLTRFDLKDKADQYPDRLSGGQQQRVAIIRSLAVNPRLLLLDEVTSALDPVLVNEVLSIVRDLKHYLICDEQVQRGLQIQRVELCEQLNHAALNHPFVDVDRMDPNHLAQLRQMFA
jgi:polar amino acid transport system ATP-binding protein